jgi:uncharacterized protein (TIGR03435 family)
MQFQFLVEGANGAGWNRCRALVNSGINGLIDYRLVYLPEDRMTNPTTADAPISDDPPAPSIFTVPQEELGLKLERARGPREYLVIDRLERPSEN